jgi:hypothetical protein
MEIDGTLLAALVPLFLIQLGLIVWAIYDLVQRDRVRGGNKLVWALVIVLVNLVGPLLYLAWGRYGE